MISSQTLHIRFKFARTFIVLLFLFFNSNLFSQSNEEETDTVIKKTEVIIGNPNQDSTETVEAPYTETDADEKEDLPEYFDQKNSYTSNEDSFQKKEIPDSIKKTMLQDEEFWYANHVFEKEKERIFKKSTPLREQTWFKTLMWLIIIGGFSYALISYLGSNNIGLFRRSVKGIAEESQIIETENIFEINYRERIERAVKAGNYQLAVRLHFLQMLKSLAGKNIIQYKQDRTNFDYLMQLRSSAYYNDFFKLTRNYEYAWFGDFPVNEETYTVIKNNFEKFDSGLLRK